MTNAKTPNPNAKGWKQCAVCAKAFRFVRFVRSTARYCSPACRSKDWRGGKA